MVRQTLKIGSREIGENKPVFVIGEIGLNHNGDITLAKQLIDAAVDAGADAVKFQKRDPEVCVPEEQKGVMRDTPWGRMTYLEYRYKVEFGLEEYRELDSYCRQKGISWTASCWDENSVAFMDQFDIDFHKVASATLTDEGLLRKLAEQNKPIILSSGMSTQNEIKQAISVVDSCPLALLHCTSTYPCQLEELNLNCIPALKAEYAFPIGYSGHEVGLVPTWGAVALGAQLIERHITLDRTMWGSDQVASVEPNGFSRLVQGIRDMEKSLGDGVKQVYESEIPIKKKLRRVG